MALTAAFSAGVFGQGNHIFDVVKNRGGENTRNISWGPPRIVSSDNCYFLECKGHGATSRVGTEVSVVRHLQSDDEFRLAPSDLVSQGKLVFKANWTDQEGGGRPLTKGTGRSIADLAQRLTGPRAFNRISAPDASSCAGCHNTPYGISGGGGDFVTNVFVVAQRFDFITFKAGDAEQPASLQTAGNLRSTTGLFGSGYIEMLARQITVDLQQIRDSIRHGEMRELSAKGIRFGSLSLTHEGLWDTSRVEGLPRLSLLSTGSHDPPTLVIRPWHQSASVVSLREFTNNAFNHHHGMQSTERFGLDTDPDGDGFKNELTRGDITAVTLYQAALQVPGRVIPNDPEIEAAVLNGERVFEKFGCVHCHIPQLPLDKRGWIFTEPNPYNPPGNLRMGDAPTISTDLTGSDLPAPRLTRDKNGVVWVPAYTDFKLHDICEPEDAEPLDMNQPTWSPEFHKGNRRFLTKRLWGAANESPYFHHGMFTTMRRAIQAHAGEASESRAAFRNASKYDQDSLIEFLKTLQVLPPGTKDLIVDENFKPKVWPPRASQERR